MDTSAPEKLLETLFNSFDTTNSGYLRKDDLKKLCKGISLTDDEFETIFIELDQDGDEKISRQDFVQGFADSHELFLQNSPSLHLTDQTNRQADTAASISNKTSTKSNGYKYGSDNVTRGVTRGNFENTSAFSQGSSLEDEIEQVTGNGDNRRLSSWKHFTEEIGLDYYLMSQEGQEEVCDMYQKLSDPTTQHLLENFENVITSLVREVKKHECENERMEKSLKREKEEHSRHLKQLEEEMEAQVQRVEARIHKQESGRFEQEKQELKTEFESEILQLQDNLKKLQKLEVPVQGDSTGMKAQLEELCQENRLLKRSLTDVQTNLALQRSELVTLRGSYEEKKRELNLEKNTLLDYIKEQESLSKQVIMLQGANKTLHDANDDMRATLEMTEIGSPPSKNIKSITEGFYQPALIYFSQPPLSLGMSTTQDNKSEYVREYLTSTPIHSFDRYNSGMSSCLAEELSKSTSTRSRRVLPVQDSVEIEDLPEDFDSGHSTLQGIAEVDLESEIHSTTSRHSNISHEDIYQHRTSNRSSHLGPLQTAKTLTSDSEENVKILLSSRPSPQYAHTYNTSDLQEKVNYTGPQRTHTCQDASHRQDNLQYISPQHPHSCQEVESIQSPNTYPEVASQCTHACQEVRSQGTHSRHGSIAQFSHVCDESDSSVVHQLSPQISELEEDLERLRPHFSRANSTCSQCSEQSRKSAERREVAFRKTYNILEPPISSTPERMYKIVLCGDAAVGKSSFILRLCKNKFVQNLNSTLGVDFQTKTLVVDGRCIALQLWDTAGQERFRSIAKSYFRRADGVLLLYDCTYERSFMSVREWVETIEDGAQKKIPMMLVGNKTDLRDSAGERCVTYDEGHRLAREFDAIFIETSARSGNNVQEAALEFSRLLKSNEDLEVTTVGMQLHDLQVNSNKMNSTCC